MIRSGIAALFLVFALAGCAAGERRDSAEAALAGGDVISGFRILRNDLLNTGNNRAKALELFTPARRTQLDQAYAAQIQNLNSTASAVVLRRDVDAMARAGLVTQARADALTDAVHDRLTAQIVAGVVQPTVNELIEDLPRVLARPQVAPRAVRNTLTILRGDPAGKSAPRRPDVVALFNYLSTTGSFFLSEVEASLPKIVFSLRELKYDVAAKFPDLARVRMEPMITDIVVLSSRADRLLAVDLTDIFRRNEELRVVGGPETAEAVVDVSELQYRERERGPSVRRVTVPPDRIERVYKPEHIPDGSAFIYDVEESAYELEWAYEIRVEMQGGRQSTSVVRDTETRGGYRCMGFAYITPAGVLVPDDEGPNYEVRSFCRDAQRLLTGDIRPGILETLAARALRMIDDLTQ